METFFHLRTANRVARILPVLILLVLCSFLDRTNVGNAKIYNMESDLGMTNGQYIQGLAAFYPLYIAAWVGSMSTSLPMMITNYCDKREIPSNLVLKRITPRIWLAFLTLVWGIVCMSIGLIHNFTQFVSLRAILGLAEGGLFPGMVNLFSFFLLARALRRRALLTSLRCSRCSTCLLSTHDPNLP